ncbi:hypothetical protein [Leucobacter japonicus]|uniref:hypothetical protein n=1 Tax=Leucobacter japonicus TaxID=1461259 RepID=UPI0006A7B6EC|nr:hypothetical protein [Leucobacter japonicus]
MHRSHPWRIDGAPTTAHLDHEALREFRFSNGLGFPKSYVDFIERYGWARTFGLWLIYPPVRSGFADGRARAEHLTTRFRAQFREGRIEDFDWMIEPDGSWELAERLDVFGWSENGDFLLWDPAGARADGEFPVWESRRADTLYLLGATLDEALPRLRAGSVLHREHPELPDVQPLLAVRL